MKRLLKEPLLHFLLLGAALFIAHRLISGRVDGEPERIVITQGQIASIEVGERPWGIAVSPDGSTVFTANGPSNDVSIVDVASRTVKAKVPVGDRPWGIVYVP